MADTQEYVGGFFCKWIMAWRKLDIYYVGYLSRVVVLAVAAIR